MTIKGWEYDFSEEDEPLEATAEAYERFMETAVWRDMKNWLKFRLEHLRHLLENAETLEDMRGFQFAIKQCKDALSLPDRLKSEVEENNRKEEQND